MKKISITFFIFLITLMSNYSLVFSQNINIPGFGNIPFTQQGDLYSLDFGKMGKFSFSGTVKPLSLSATVGMDDLKAFPGAKVMSALGLQDIVMTVKDKGLEIAANFDDKIKDDIADELKKIKILAPVIGTIFNTLEIRESQAALLFNMDGKLGGKLDINIYVFGVKLPIPEIEGTLVLDEIIGSIVGVIKDKGVGIIGDVGKIISDAGSLAMSGINSGIGEVNKYAKLGGIKVNHVHSAGHCMDHCVPKRADRLANEVLPRSINAIVQYYTNIIDDLAMIEGINAEETKKLREAMFLQEWTKINNKIEQDWEEVKGDKEYVGYFLTQGDAEKGGRKYRELIEIGKKNYLKVRDGIYSNMIAAKLLNGNTIARIKNMQTKTHLNNETGPITVSKSGTAWWSAQWQISRIWGTDFVRIKNRNKKTYLHIENGKVECSAIGEGAFSAHWKVERISGTDTYRLKNRWKGTYLDVVSEKLMCTSSLADKVSSQWEIKYDKVGNSANYNKDQYYGSVGYSLLVSKNRKYRLVFQDGLFQVKRYEAKTVWRSTQAVNTSMINLTANKKNRLVIEDNAKLVIYDANKKQIWTNNVVDFDIKTFAFFELKSEHKNTYIHTETGLTHGNRDKGWWSSQWYFEPVEGTEYMRIKNRHTGGYLNVEFGSLQCTPAGIELESAHWIVQKVPGKHSVRLINRWKGTYINVETGKLSCTQAGQGWYSAMWEVQYIK